MPTVHPNLDDDLPPDELSQLQLRVARRADEIARQRHSRPVLNVHCWLLAEAEIWRLRSGEGRTNPSLRRDITLMG